MAANEQRYVRGLGNAGDGIVETDQGLIFVPGALPGDSVRQDAEGHWVHDEAASSERRDLALCPHAACCGGCSVQHMSDDLYRRWKATLLPETFRTHGLKADFKPMIEVPCGSRRRAVLSAQRIGATVAIGFHGLRSHVIEPLEACAVLAPAIVGALPAMRAAVDILLERTREMRISVISTPHGLDIDFDGDKATLSAADRSALAGIAAQHGIARLSLKGDVVVSRSRPGLSIAHVEVVPPPGAFLQATREAEIAMQEIAVSALERPRAKHAADLFSGLGTFALTMARRVSVLAVDSDRALVNALEAAWRSAQGLKPVETKVRDLYQDPLSPRELDDFDAVLFDPPRAGAKMQAEALARSKVRTVIAVSCNPATLARDLKTLIAGGYRIESITPVDQFLFTPHLEVIAVLRRS